MATGANISRVSKRAVAKSVLHLRQKVHFFKWKVWKYSDASETYFMERNHEMMDFCDKNVEAFKRALSAAERTLASVEKRLADM